MVATEAGGEDGRTELLGPGHPLFESVLQAAESGMSASSSRAGSTPTEWAHHLGDRVLIYAASGS
ncbi:MAG: hypothetical protein EOM91_14280 [Sphingobacteriia bacterium]|nr:hypothetical protein [Sphingobacteriia bacterium]NCC40235.1 hypothetical protein [Gammaproteobacteria bacterium]